MSDVPQRDMFLTPELIAKAVFIGVDVQEFFCRPYEGQNSYSRGNQKTDHVARKMACLAPEFNAHGLDVVWLYMQRSYGLGEFTSDTSPLYKVGADGIGIKIPKNSDSAFYDNTNPGAETPLMQYLREQDKQILFVGGVNKNGCLLATAKDAIKKGFVVIILDDLAANDKQVVYEMSARNYDESVHFWTVMYDQMSIYSNWHTRLDVHHSSALLKAIKRLNGPV